MVEVYFESGKFAELVAIFDNEDIYMSCLPALEVIAKNANMVITERVIDTVDIDELS